MTRHIEAEILNVMEHDELEPGDLPIWALLQFNEMIPSTYRYQDGRVRHSKEAKIAGFKRQGDVICIYFEMAWDDEARPLHYLWMCSKDWAYKNHHGYSLTPLTDPTAFPENRDGRHYHLCDLSPGHNHHVPFPYAHCYEFGSWTWESRYATSTIW